MSRTAEGRDSMGEAGKGALGGIIARQRPDASSREPEKCLLSYGIVIRSSERPMIPARRDGPEGIREMPA